MSYFPFTIAIGLLFFWYEIRSVHVPDMCGDGGGACRNEVEVYETGGWNL